VEGCPCTTAGQTVSCGHLVSQSGDYVTCSEGTSVCQAGTWGACQGSQLVTKSLSGSSIGAGGIRIQSTVMKCTDPCALNGCTQVSFDAGDVDVFGLAQGDGGLTIEPGVSQDAGCVNGQPTVLTGKAYDPAGVNPLYNAYVYIPADPNLPPFPAGAACDSCASEPPIHVVTFTRTDATGSFTLPNVPAGAPIPLVVQMGKWRRETMLPAVAPCSTTVVSPDDARLPRNRFDGNGNQADIPKLAISTGRADPFQCLLLKMGLDPAEFQVPGSGNGRIDYYVTNGMPFTGGAATATPLSALAGSVGTLSGYDAVILPCEQGEDDGNNQYATNMANYAMAGGRFFATHLSYTWLATPTMPPDVANAINPATGQPNPFYVVGADPVTGTNYWDLQGYYYGGTANATIDTTFPKGQAFHDWLGAVGALDGMGQITLDAPRRDIDGVTSYATAWMHHVPSTAPENTAEPFQLTVNTPLTMSAGMGDAGAGDDGGDAGDAGAAPTCGRVAFTDYHTTAAALITSAECGADADCGFGSTCQGATVGSCVPPACLHDSDCNSPNYTCAVGKGTCECFSDADCAPSGGGSCQGGGLGGCGCASNAECQAMNAGICHFYMGASCTQPTCYQGSECQAGVCNGTTGTCTASGPCTVANQATQCASHVCQAGQCVPPATNVCETNADCGTAETCSGAQIGSCQCQSDPDCPPGGGTCAGGIAGTCTIATCHDNTACTAGPHYCTGMGQLGSCSTATCASDTDCAGPAKCDGAGGGTCQPKACTTNADCGGTNRCNNGVCSGCLGSSDCPGKLTCVGGSTGKCSGDFTQFPFACKKGPLSAQESALEFTLLDLTSCISPDDAPPPPPPLIYTFHPATFIEDVTAVCPQDGGAVGTHPVWRELDWFASIPDTASIAFSAQTVDSSPDGGPPDYTNAQVVPIYTATVSSPPQGDVAYIDIRGDASMPGAFNVAMPPVTSEANLRLTITLNPTADATAAPTLDWWQLRYDCDPSE
jgi:hypothetical protein